MNLFIITENDGKTINGMASKDDIKDVFLAILMTGMPGVPKVDMRLVTVAEFERIAAGQNVNGEKMPARAPVQKSTPPLVLNHDIKGDAARFMDFLSGGLEA